MSHNANQILIRAKDVALLVTILSLLGMFVKLANKPTEWDQDTSRLDRIEPIVASHETRLAVIDARSQDILEQLRSINRKLDRR